MPQPSVGRLSIRRKAGSTHESWRGELAPGETPASRWRQAPDYSSTSPSRRGPTEFELTKLRARFQKWAFNLFPAFRGTGGWITHIAPDHSEVRVRVPLSWRTRNYVGTIFGGSMYGAVDPIYMLMLIRRLGPNYTVWDKGATVRFRRPGRTTLFAHFVVDDDEIRRIKTLLAHQERIDRTYRIDLVDREGEVHATVEKVISIRSKLAGGS